MNLFFETTVQANCFLCMVPVGFAIAACLDVSAFLGRFRLLLDILVLLLAGMGVLMLISVMQEGSLRAYHLLGLLTGAIVYLQGIGRLLRMIIRKLNRNQIENKTSGRKMDSACRNI